MRIALIGSTGTIGGAVADALGARYDVISIGHTRGDYRVDMASPPSIRALFTALGKVDAVVCTAGQAKFGPLALLTDSDFEVGLHNKLMGQVNIVRYGLEYVADGGTFTLTSGILARHPVSGSAAISLVNAGVEAFVRAAALELPRGLRINAVSPGWVSETLAAMGRNPSDGTPAAEVAKDYAASVEGSATGHIFGPE